MQKQQIIAYIFKIWLRCISQLQLVCVRCIFHDYYSATKPAYFSAKLRLRGKACPSKARLTFP